MTRDEMIASLEFINRKEALMRSYRAAYPTTWEYLPNQIPDEQLMDRIAVDLGLPLGTILSEDQIRMLLQRERPAQ